MFNKAPTIAPNKFPEIVVTHKAYTKICAYTDLCNNEISALGCVKIEDNKIVIEDIYLFEQYVTGASTDISQKDVANFLCEYIRNGKDPSKLKFWWHSHATMGVFWSGTDINTINRFSSDWMISMVSNKHGDIKLRIDMFSPFRIYLDDVPFTVEYDTSMNVAYKKEITAKVKETFFPSFTQYTRGRDCEVVYDEKTPIGTVNAEQAIYGKRPSATEVAVRQADTLAAPSKDKKAPAIRSDDVMEKKDSLTVREIPEYKPPKKDPLDNRGIIRRIYDSLYRTVVGEKW